MIYLFILFIICYMLFLVWLSNGIINYKSIEDETFHPNVSIIISVHNEEKNLPDLLNILVKQDYSSEYEIIIANDRSSDDTKKIISSYAQKYNYIKLINIQETPIGWGHKKWALNKCIEKAKFNIILQTDGDCLPKPQWINSMIKDFSDSNVVFISGPAPMQSDNNILSEYYKLDSLAQDGLSAAALTRDISFSCTGRNIAFLKSAFLDINGYDGIENYESGDDDLLLQKFSTLSNGKIKFIFNLDAMVVSDPPKSIKEFLNQRIRYASKGFEYYKLNTSIEFRLFLPFLYLINLMCLLGLLLFIQKIQIIYITPIVFKCIADYWLCSIFFHKLKLDFPIVEFFVLSIIHPIYIVSLGLFSPFANYQWKDNV